MCIICNCGLEAGDDFLFEFASAQAAMKLAKAAMLKCSQVATTPDARKKYDATHKEIARIVRDWNRLEELRENGHA